MHTFTQNDVTMCTDSCESSKMNLNHLMLVERLQNLTRLWQNTLEEFKDTHAHYLGKTQNQLIQIISEAVQEEIPESLNKCKVLFYYC
jgi:hypothetical protein